uniref:Flavin-containing monooxygenase n=1 Tax=Chlamydomonas euryale TaxID=1486919 RepID=A0A7R9YW83_9CHLO|mmetsp:Transcript_298/g.765  ORF Transcript_298/g.765 Transcript_298/m.765 type:complete len:358 (+) Transcript_298:237-1310(+)
MHSHNYREPGAFRDQVVLVVGASNSGSDISREIAGVASRVLVAARNWTPDAGVGKSSRPYGERANIYRYPMVSELAADGAAMFLGGEGVPHVDTVVYCTGYRYTFPFLLEVGSSEHDSCAGQGKDPDGAGGRGSSGGADGHSAGGGGGDLPGERSEPPQVLLPHVPAVPCTGASSLPHSTLRVEQQRVGPLYQHLFPPALAPHLSFLGLPWKVVPFPQQELQAKLVARCLSGRARLPSVDAMKDHIERFYRQLDEQGMPVRYTHMQNAEQWAYNDELARMCGEDVPRTTAWRKQMYSESSLAKRLLPETYRDGPFTPEDERAIRFAHEELEAQAARLTAERPGWLAADPSLLAGSRL